MPLFPFFCRPTTPQAAPAAPELPARAPVRDEPQFQSGMAFFPGFDSNPPTPQVSVPPPVVLPRTPRRPAAPPAPAQSTNEFARAAMVYQGPSQNGAARSLRSIDARSDASRNSRSNSRRHPLAFLGPMARPFINSPPSSPEQTSSSPSRPPPPQRYPHLQPLSSHPSHYDARATFCVARPTFLNRFPAGVPPNLTLSTAPTLFRTTFPSGAALIPNPNPRARPVRGLYSAISAVVASVAANQWSLGVRTPDPQVLRDLHRQYAMLKERLGRPIPRSQRSEDFPFTRSSLSVMVYLWGRRQGVRLGLGMVSRDVLAGEGYRATVTLVVGEDGVAEPEGVVWVLDEAGMEGFDDAWDVYTHLAKFRGLRPGGFSELGGMSVIAPTSELKLLRQVPGTAGQ